MRDDLAVRNHHGAHRFIGPDYLADGLPGIDKISFEPFLKGMRRNDYPKQRGNTRGSVRSIWANQPPR